MHPNILLLDHFQPPAPTELFESVAPPPPPPPLPGTASGEQDQTESMFEEFQNCSCISDSDAGNMVDDQKTPSRAVGKLRCPSTPRKHLYIRNFFSIKEPQMREDAIEKVFRRVRINAYKAKQPAQTPSSHRPSRRKRLVDDYLDSDRIYPNQNQPGDAPSRPQRRHTSLRAYHSMNRSFLENWERNVIGGFRKRMSALGYKIAQGHVVRRKLEFPKMV